MVFKMSAEHSNSPTFGGLFPTVMLEKRVLKEALLGVQFFTELRICFAKRRDEAERHLGGHSPNFAIDVAVWRILQRSIISGFIQRGRSRGCRAHGVVSRG